MTLAVNTNTSTAARVGCMVGVVWECILECCTLTCPWLLVVSQAECCTELD